MRLYRTKNLLHSKENSQQSEMAKQTKMKWQPMDWEKLIVTHIYLIIIVNNTLGVNT